MSSKPKIRGQKVLDDSINIFKKRIVTTSKCGQQRNLEALKKKKKEAILTPELSKAEKYWS